jgi:hypothetical protein
MIYDSTGEVSHASCIGYTKAISERDSRLEPRVSALESRVDKLESK